MHINSAGECDEQNDRRLFELLEMLCRENHPAPINPLSIGHRQGTIKVTTEIAEAPVEVTFRLGSIAHEVLVAPEDIPPEGISGLEVTLRVSREAGNYNSKRLPEKMACLLGKQGTCSNNGRGELIIVWRFTYYLQHSQDMLSERLN